jgi:AcrR family transcriptional regulator
MSVGLRERKKLKTRAAIQKEALRLFAEKGYEATTIEEIAAAVEISPSTFFNYFPSKEAVVYQDDLDPLIFAAFDAQPADVTPITALRNAMRAVFSKLSAEDRAEMQTRTALVLSSPELRAATLNQFAELVDQFAEMLGHRVGRSPSDFAIRNMAGALLGVLMASYFATAADPKADLVEVIDRSMAHLEAGLPL